MDEETLEKKLCLDCITSRLKLCNLELPSKVGSLRALYFGTYTDQFHFWSDTNRTFQRLDSYEDEFLLVIDESLLISQSDYLLYKMDYKF